MVYKNPLILETKSAGHYTMKHFPLDQVLGKLALNFAHFGNKNLSLCTNSHKNHQME